jgi:hypothetical protein
MTTQRRGRAAQMVAVIVTCSAGWVIAQDGQEGEDDLPPPPPVILRLTEVAKNPDRFRELMSDPRRVAAVMEAMDNDAVREFMADPRRVAAVTRQLDMQAVQEAVRSIDRAKVRDAMLARWKQRLKQQLEATDEEWKVLEPLILKVTRARRDARLDPRTLGGVVVGTGAFPSVPGDGPSAVDEAEAALREMERDPDAPRQDVARCLADYRRVRNAARKRLDAVEDELKAVLNQRQESILILLGILR